MFGFLTDCDGLRELQVTSLDVGEEFLQVVGEEWSYSIDHLIKHGSQPIDVCRLVHSSPVYHLRGQVRRRPTKALQIYILKSLFGETEVDELYMTSLVKQNIFRLQISVNDVFCV